MKILVINPGSTSTKVALYENEVEIVSKSIPVDLESIKHMESLYDQLDIRTDLVATFLKENGFTSKDLDVVVSRGGMLPPVHTGAYVIDEKLVDTLRNHPAQIHASNLGALIADHFVKEAGIPAYVYDPVTVDELTDIARISGIKGRDRSSYNHVLNTRAIALRHCKEMDLDYGNITLLCAHLGGGISLNVQKDGRMIDICSAEEGPFSSERAGGLQLFSCVEIAKDKGIESLLKYEGGKGGLVSYLGTNDAREVERMIDAGNKEAKIVFEAMAYQIAKQIGALAAAVDGKVDGILLTGGMAYSKRLADWIIEKVSWIALVNVYPGEFEMKALAEGAYRVMKGQETPRNL